MRILIVASEFPPGPGGIGTHAYQLAIQLHRFGHDIRIIANLDYASPEQIALFTARQPFPVRRLARLPGPLLKVGYRIALLRQAIARWRPDVMLASGDREIYAAALASGNLPWIAVEHGRRPLARWEKRVKRSAFGRADRVIAVSEYSKAQLLELGARPRSSAVIHNGADAQRFQPRPGGDKAVVLAELGVANAHLILSIGHVSDRKGQDVMIAAMPELLRKVPDAHYLIVGKPTKAPEYSALAARLGVAERVHFLGQVEPERLVHLLGACDLHVMTSRHTPEEFEGFGIAVVEAALCQKPSVVSGSSGLTEAIIDGETGLVARLADPADTARAVATILGDEALRQRMASAAYAHASQHQTWEHCAKAYEAALADVARSGPAVRRS